MARGARVQANVRTETYQHPKADLAMRPEVGTQPQFRKRKPPATYRYDSSLSPSLEWDGKNPVREQGEWLLASIDEAAKLPSPQEFDQPRIFRRDDGTVIATCRGLRDAIDQLKRLGKAFLNWAGKAERLSFDVPTLPLFVHERLSTMAIVETLKDHTKEALSPQLGMFELFGDPQRPIADQVLKAYEYRDKWVNRMILGDSLVVMNSLLHYEGLGGQVQMIYIDPPYGVKFGSNFQPFVRKREVSHNDDEDLTREPEMVKAYRDTWEIGLHSYLTYLRDRFLLSRELLSPTGSIFVQISDENLHHVRELMEDVFGVENFVVTFLVKKTGSQKAGLIEAVNDYLIWFSRDITRINERFSKLYERTPLEQQVLEGFNYVELPSGEEIGISELSAKSKADYIREPHRLVEDFPGARIFAPNPLTSGGFRRNQSLKYTFQGREFDPGISSGSCWKHTAITEDGSPSGMDRLASANRLFVGRNQLRFKRYTDDFGFKEITNWWDGLGGASRPIYVVQTNTEIIKRCILMTTQPGDLVLDPTCGSGTTAYVAEQWGRRWITVDTSRVPVALARQRLLTATYDYFQLKDETRGPSGGFSYSKRQNRKNEQVGGIVSHVTSSTIANDEPPEETIMVDRPNIITNITRVAGPFCVEATIPTPVGWEDGDPDADSETDDSGSFVDRMLEILRRSPVLQLGAGKTVVLRNVRLPVKSLSLSAEAVVEGDARGGSIGFIDPLDAADERNLGTLPLTQKPVALVFGPENGAISETLVFEAAREAHGKSYTHLYVIGFAIQPNARRLIEDCDSAIGIAATYFQATPDLMMGDLLKTMRSSQIFSVCGMPDVRLVKLPHEGTEQPARYQVSLLGLDSFDPTTMEPNHLKGDDVPTWLLDTNYNGLVFHGSQVFFPRTSAWENLKRALSATHDPSVWEHLAGSVSAPFEAGEHQRVAVKVIDDRGNELIVIKLLAEAL